MTNVQRKEIRVQPVVGSRFKVWQILNEHGGLLEYVEGSKKMADKRADEIRSEVPRE